MIQPQNDRVLIQRVEEPSGLLLPDRSKSIKGLVLAVGPGKWIEGTWWQFQKPTQRWEWIPGHRQELVVKPGDKVLFNSKWNDFTHAENKGTGADGSGALERPLSYKLDPLIHLVTESDIFAIVGHFDFKAETGKTVLEETFFRNLTTVEAS